MILCPLELIFSVVLLMASAAYKSFWVITLVGPQNRVWWLVSTLRFYITTTSELKKNMMDNVNFSLLFWVSSLISVLAVWSIRVRYFYILGGHIWIIALYWGCIKLWYSYDHEIFPFLKQSTQCNGDSLSGGGSWGVFIFACPVLWSKQR